MFFGSILSFLKSLFDTITLFLGMQRDDELREDGAAKAENEGLKRTLERTEIANEVRSKPTPNKLSDITDRL